MRFPYLIWLLRKGDESAPVFKRAISASVRLRSVMSGTNAPGEPPGWSAGIFSGLTEGGL